MKSEINPEEVSAEVVLARAQLATRQAARQLADKDIKIADTLEALAFAMTEIKHLRGQLARRDEEITGLKLAAEGGGRPDPAGTLISAARGRRKYLDQLPEGDEARKILEVEIATIEAAARVVDGDDGPLFGWLPSWLWTDEMVASLRS